MKLQLPKGTRDFAPREKLARDKIVARLTCIFQSYGFMPLETPSFERWEVLSAKYAGGAEILNETFRFTDQGGRELALRYDLTVPLARYVAMNPQLKMPFKRYAIGKVFRDGPIKLGRYREFYQCDVDTIGAASMLADAECIRLGNAVFNELGIKAVYSVNNRKVLEALLAKGGVPKEKLIDAMLTLDKLEKVGLDNVQKELAEKGIPESSVTFVVALREKSNEEKLEAIKQELGEEAIKELTELFSYLEGVPIDFNPALSRGLAYYTSTVFEAFAQNSKVTSSLSGGGRYDNMIGGLVGRGDIPAVGVSFGLEPILDVLKEQGLEEAGVVQLYVVPIRTMKESAGIAEQLRAAGINVALDLKGRSISKNLEYANSEGIPFVVIVGPKELEAGTVKLRDMKAGTEAELSVEEVAQRVKAAR
ncbi:histidine--tRNA ligase [Candidatus Woesearchaeota archaeon]|nr:MAG: histidine--tRNA ligase [Candidatus Woesearchaeota archaeon]